MPHSRPDFVVYQDSLFHLGHGFPLWRADPGSTGEIEVGDIGYCEAGRFHRVHHLNVQDICGIAVPEPENNPFPQPLKYKVTKDFKRSASVGVHPPFSPVTASGRASAEHTYDEEATLSLKNRNALVCCLPQREREILELYISNHYKEWLKFNITNEEDIIVVTGTYKTGDWNARASTKWSRNVSAEGVLEGGGVLDASAGFEQDEWESRTPGYNCGHLHQETPIGGAHGLYDFPQCGRNPCLPPAQCIFLRTSRVRVKGRMGNRALVQIIADNVKARYRIMKLNDESNKPPPSKKPLPPLPGSSRGSSSNQTMGASLSISAEGILAESDCEAYYDTIAYHKFQENPSSDTVVVSDEEVIDYFNFGHNPAHISADRSAQVSVENMELISGDTEAFYDTVAHQKFLENPTLETVVISDEEVIEHFDLNKVAMSEAKFTSLSGSTTPTSSTTMNLKTPSLTKTPSLLNPTRTPVNSLPPSNLPTLPILLSGHPREQSLSSVLGTKHRSSSASPLRSSASSQQTVSGAPRMKASPTSELSQLRPESPVSDTRSRSRSPSTYDRVISSTDLENPSTPPNSPPSTWWGRNMRRDRPWRDPGSPVSSVHSSPTGSPKPAPRKLVHGAAKTVEQGNARAKGDEKWRDDEHSTLFGAPLSRRPTAATVPKEQTEGWERTRQRVTEALSKLLPQTILVTHDLLKVSTKVLNFVPIPGLDVAATLLLSIWDSVQGVDTNRLSCLRLTERCANLLLSVVQEVHEMGDKVEKEMKEPLQKLIQTFTQVRDLLIKQAHQPFLTRYLKWEQTMRDIAGCDTSLTNALSMFSLSVQIRILRQVKETEDRRDAENRALLEALRAKQQNALGITVDQEQLTPRPVLSPLPLEREHDHTDVLPALYSIHSSQNTLDFAHDTADLRSLLRDALATSNDVEMLRVLQVGRSEMPEALKTLQRALERVGVVTTPLPPAPPGYAPRSGVPQQSATLESSASSDTSSPGLTMPHDTLDHEFIEGGIGALQRMSKGGEVLPSWTITRYEVDRDVKIGIGFFSNVYKGTWRGRTVAIKCLAETTPRDLFLREVSVWKELKHPNVLDLYGASGVSGDGPWFFVCPYERFGSLSGFLQRVAQEGDAVKNSREGDLLRFMHEIAKGMEYLHDKGVLHGDLKAANVLVDDRIHCLVSDFGQSEMKAEAYRISGAAPPHGTLRWQPPELMLGSSELTPAMDVYSYAICCVEILSMGRLPWPLLTDEAVRNFVLKDNTRPEIPPSRFNTPALQELLCICWDKDPTVRPQFSSIVKEAKQLRKAAELPFEGFDDLASPPVSPDWREVGNASIAWPSPDMHPVPLPNTPTMDVPSSFAFSGKLVSSEPSSTDSYHTVSQWPPAGDLVSHREDTVSSSGSDVPEPVVYTASSRASSIFTPSTKSSSVDDLTDFQLADYGGYESPMPADERIAEIRNERRYRLLLAHDFHPSLTLPLWNPLPIQIGAVGFLDKSSGSFVTLLNCFTPDKAADGDSGLPSVYGYGRVTTGSQRQDKRSAAQRGLDAIAGLLTFKKSDGPVSQNVSRRYTYPLQSRHKAAYLCTETTIYRYIEYLDAPKKWFKSNVDAIMRQYGPIHQIQKEDLYLVIGTLDAPDYALFVSHNHPDGQAHFNVYSSPKSGQPWGTFTTDTEPEQGGPSYHEPISGSPLSSCKVSSTGQPWNTVLVARLRFKPDVLEPTCL